MTPTATEKHTVVVEAVRRTGRRGRTRFEAAAREPTRPAAPRMRAAAVACVLALAHHIEAAIKCGTFRNRAEAARRLGQADARITQVLNLLVLAPDIQEHVLFLEAGVGEEALTERALRQVARALDWDEQRRAFRLLTGSRD